MNTLQRIRTASTWLSSHEPFVHQMLLRVHLRMSKRFATMAIGMENVSVVLYYNPEFVRQLSEPELRFALCHEIYHACLHHITLRRGPSGLVQTEISNLAADMAVNTLIRSSPDIQAPSGAHTVVMPDTPPWRFPRGLSMESYRELVSRMVLPPPSKGLDSHELWGKAPDPAAVDAWISAVVQKIDTYLRGRWDRGAERTWGNESGFVRKTILAAQQRAVDWRKQFRMLAGTSLVPGSPQHTLKRPDRRYGYPFPGRRRGRGPHVLAAADASGSISDEQFAAFINEMHTMCRYGQVDYVQFDEDIKGPPQRLRPGTHKLERIGYGGTNFDPVMQLAREQGYHMLVMLTDGWAEPPPRPAGVDVIWVITGDGGPPVRWGRTVCMSE